MLDLDIIKQHCRIEPDFSEDDFLLTTYSEAAWRFVEARTDRLMYESIEDVPLDIDGVPLVDSLVVNSAIRAAMLLLIGHWYANREAVVVGASPAELPMGVDSLIQPYKVYGV